ncbi:MAG: CCE_0567 family metalloprotein [Telmatospirillum sp.]|nr:CCE_0567 family metalloprotein [Telmatospirillum sp.]
MSEIDALKADLKKLSAQAIQAKMDLHDLSEELPVGWQTVTTVAARTQEAYARLHEARERLKAMENGV